MTARAPSISIDTLARGDLAAAHALTQDLRWPHRLEDWQAMLALGQGLAVRDDREALIGTGVIWSWGERVATVGLILVHPEHQGHGIGRRLVERLLAAAGDRTVRLNATEAGLKLYEQAGFARSGLVHQWQGEARRQSADPRIRLIEPHEFAHVAALDAAAFGARRDALLAQVFASGRVAVLEVGGVPAAFAVSRRFGRGTLIGPVVAPDEATADALVTALLADGFNRLDLTEAGTSLVPTLRRAGLKSADTVVVMTRGVWPACDPQAQSYALASQSFG